jgi:hypothetical protein
MKPSVAAWFETHGAGASRALFLVLLAACARRASADDSNAAPTAASSAIAPATASAAVAAGSAVDSAPGNAARVEVSPSLERSCREICDRSRRLKCENASECMPNCLAMGSITPCTEKMTAFFRCLVGQPVQNWECSPDGVAAIRPGFCESEQANAVACMETNMK